MSHPMRSDSPRRYTSKFTEDLSETEHERLSRQGQSIYWVSDNSENERHLASLQPAIARLSGSDRSPSITSMSQQASNNNTNKTIAGEDTDSMTDLLRLERYRPSDPTSSSAWDTPPRLRIEPDSVRSSLPGSISSEPSSTRLNSTAILVSDPIQRCTPPSPLRFSRVRIADNDGYQGDSESKVGSLTRRKSSHTKRLSQAFAMANLKGKLKCAVQVPEALGKDVGNAVRKGLQAVTPRRRRSSGDGSPEKGDKVSGKQRMRSSTGGNSNMSLAEWRRKRLSAGGASSKSSAEESNQTENVETPDSPKSLMFGPRSSAPGLDSTVSEKGTPGGSVERPKVIYVGSPFEDDIMPAGPRYPGM